MYGAYKVYCLFSRDPNEISGPLGTGEKLQYKAGDTMPDTPTLGGTVTEFTDFDSGDSLTIADGKKVAVVAVTAGGFVFGAGGTTVSAPP